MLAVLLISWTQMVLAAPFVSTYLNPTWTDANKLHDQGNWGVNYWNDINDNGRWDVTEPLADDMNPLWAKGKSARDLSCWIASAANMLASEGFATGNAQNIYWDMVYNMSTPWFSGGWQDGGWQHEALNWYLSNRPHPLSGLYEVSYYGIYNGEDGTTAMAWPTDPFDFAANLLAGGDELGIVVHGTIYHAITFQGYDDTLSRIDISDSDQDAHQMGFGLDPYIYDRSGNTDWFLTDYVSGGIAVDYFASFRHVPEPGIAPLIIIGLIALALQITACGSGNKNCYSR